jgi:hypothetical protein
MREKKINESRVEYAKKMAALTILQRQIYVCAEIRAYMRVVVPVVTVICMLLSGASVAIFLKYPGKFDWGDMVIANFVIFFLGIFLVISLRIIAENQDDYRL